MIVDFTFIPIYKEAMKLKFTKMHGLGNDFVIFDTRHQSLPLNDNFVRQVSDRRLGVGCDQLIIMAPPTQPEATVTMRIFNADGKEVEACGNASRCVAWLLGQEGIREPVLETLPGLLSTKIMGPHLVQVNMGPTSFEWEKIPLREPLEHSSLNLTFETLTDPIAVNVGNPHLVFFVSNLESVDMERLGHSLSTHSLFPQGTNVEVAQPLGFQEMKVKVWERGVGMTPACGSGACASAAAGARSGLTNKKVTVHLAGGSLEIETLSNNDVLMTGPVQRTFEGTLDQSLVQ